MYDGITTELSKNPRQQVLQIGVLREKKERLETRMGWEEVPVCSPAWLRIEETQSPEDPHSSTK